MAQQQTDLSRSTNYQFVLGMNKELTYSAQNANVADSTLPQSPYNVGPKDILLPSNKLEFEPLNIQILMTFDLREWIYLYKWQLKLKNKEDAFLNYAQECELMVLDDQNQTAVKFIYHDCYPTIVGGLDYSVQGDSVVVTSSCTFYYSTFSIELPTGERIPYDWDGELEG